MSLSSGTRFGAYEIVSTLGADTYKARDTRLDRTVAIRVISADWIDAPELKDRFEREARLIASLNHPNICKVHDVGRLRVSDAEVDFLVMEHLEGETLAARLERGALPVDEALRIGIAIGDAVDQAHRRGVVHRDLKPANITLTESGPKLTDFGLARAGAGSSHRSPGSYDPGKPPTPITQIGTTLGDLQYLAPEQLDGQDADARTDIFALGVVLHEMVTGRRAFEGKSQVLLISAIATSEPPVLSRVQPAVPPALDHVVKTCLAKDPDDRWQTARDVVAELRWIAEGGGAVEAAVATPSGRAAGTRATRVMLAAAGVLIAALAVPAVLYVRGAPPPERLEVRVSTTPLTYGSGNPVNTSASGMGFFAISPDGRRLALRAQERGRSEGPGPGLYVATIDFLNPLRLAGTDEASQPFWSPNGRDIAFVGNRKLFRIEATGGPAQPICDVSEFRGGTWNRDGTILFGSTAGIFSVSADGGKPAQVTTLEANDAGHFWPRFLPDGRQFLYLAWSRQKGEHTLMAGSIDTKDRKRIMALDSNALFTSGYLMLRRESSIYAQPFDPASLTLSGDQIRVADAMPHNLMHGRGPFDVSANGVLAYYRDLEAATVGGGTTGETSSEGRARDLAGQNWQLAWVNRAGQESKTVGKAGVYRSVEVSRDGTRVAVHRHDSRGGDVLVLEPGGTETRITFDASQDNSSPVWSPDGARITYVSQRQGKWGLYQAASDGSGREEMLLESELPKAPLQWSADGRYLLFWVRDPKTSDDLWVWAATDKKARPLLATDASERHGQISPDGKWIAYASALVAPRQEIYVRPFPSGTGQWQISPDDPDGAAWPRWSQKTNELFYLSAGSQPAVPRSLFSVPWKASGSTFRHDPPKPFVRIIAMNLSHSGGDYHSYAVSPDAQRVLVFQNASTVPTVSTTLSASETPDPPSGITVILNWVQGIKK